MCNLEVREHCELKLGAGGTIRRMRMAEDKEKGKVREKKELDGATNPSQRE